MELVYVCVPKQKVIYAADLYHSMYLMMTACQTSIQ